MNQQSEQQLVELLKLGDTTAVEYWFGEFYPKVLRFSRGKVGSSQDAEELAQQVFMNCLRNIQLYSGSARLWTWMLAVAKHEVADYYRKRYAKKAIQTTALSYLLPVENVEDSHEVSAKVLSALHKMSSSSRELLLQKYVDSKKVAQIARELGKSVKSVESELFRARAQFRYLYLQGEKTA